MAKSNIYWPNSFPPGLRGKSLTRKSPNRDSEMASGRVISRRSFPGTPWETRITWLMTSGQAQAFMAWVRDVLRDGIYWFNCPVATPIGYNLHAMRIVGWYETDETGPGLWSISAKLEFDEEPIAPVGQGQYPDELVYSKIFDLTMNRDWAKK